MPTKKDNVDLICSIGELAGLFEKSASLEDFLQTVVSIVAYHMRAAVCSVYIYEEDTQELVLTATQGLSMENAGQVRLKLGEGLTGLALKELRPIREGSGFHNPHFKYIPGIYEEKYQAFLAVPILRGLTRVGVMVLQDPVTDYFDENDTKALQAIAAQLATTIENAKLLMTLHRMRSDLAAELKEAEAEFRETPRFIKGSPGAGGYATGRPTIFSAAGEQFVVDDAPAGAGGTLEDFERALKRTEEQLEDLQVQLEEKLADVASMIFSAHILIVKDPKFSGSMSELIRNGMSARNAIITVVGNYISMFAESKNPRLREKVQDLKDLGHRLIHNLGTNQDDVGDYADHVVIAGELLPSDVLKLHAQNAAGIIMVGGGMTAHVAILARSLDLPMAIVNDRILFDLPPDRMLLVDGDQGNVYIDPDDEVLSQFREMEESRREAESFAASWEGPLVTRDGVAVRILANINMLSELEAARRLKAEGVGLYRSEFPFIVRSNFPSEEEQYRVYRTLVEGMGDRPVTMRTLDVGGDKALSYFPGKQESNPFLGLRAIRFSLRYKDVFIQQLRAMIRAGEGHALRIMFPLISSVDDFLEARGILRQCIEDLGRENVPHHPRPDVGVMIELPAAVEVVDELAAEADFLSIGGNDLVQYTLAVDRTNEHISDMYLTHHPAVLRALKRIAVAAQKHKRSLSFCGEVASNPRLFTYLAGIGVRDFSVDARAIPRIHKALTSLSVKDAEAFSGKLLATATIRDIEKIAIPAPGGSS